MACTLYLQCAGLSLAWISSSGNWKSDFSVFYGTCWEWGAAPSFTVSVLWMCLFSMLSIATEQGCALDTIVLWILELAIIFNLDFFPTSKKLTTTGICHLELKLSPMYVPYDFFCHSFSPNANYSLWFWASLFVLLTRYESDQYYKAHHDYFSDEVLSIFSLWNNV